MIVIEQDQTEVRASFALNTNAALVAVRLAEATLRSQSQFQREAGDDTQQLETTYQFQPVSVLLSENRLVVGISFGLTVRPEVDETAPAVTPADEVFRVDCLFEADYEIRSGFVPTEEQIRAFHHGNAIFNCWPFFREFVQNSVTRMNYPPPPVPFLRMMPRREDQTAIVPPEPSVRPGRRPKSRPSS
jgi:hypothetical protein